MAFPVQINDNLAAGNCFGVTVTDACGQTASQCFSLPPYALPAIADEYTHPCLRHQPDRFGKPNAYRGLSTLVVQLELAPADLQDSYEYAGPERGPQRRLFCDGDRCLWEE
jgi:hypothetical protein